jgi:uncharacterized coiled-coil protein SlyX
MPTPKITFSTQSVSGKEAYDTRIARIDKDSEILRVIFQRVLEMHDECRAGVESVKAAQQIPVTDNTAVTDGIIRTVRGLREALEKFSTVLCENKVAVGILEEDVEDLIKKVNSGLNNASSDSDAGPTRVRLVRLENAVNGFETNPGLQNRMAAVEQASSNVSSSAMDEKFAAMERRMNLLEDTVTAQQTTIRKQNDTMKSLRKTVDLQNTEIISQKNEIGLQKTEIGQLDKKVEDLKRWVNGS